MAIYCERCRTRIVSGTRCTTCGHINPGIAEATAPSMPSQSQPLSNPVPPPPPSPPSSSSKKTGLFVGVGVAVALLVALVVFVATRDGDKPPVRVEYTLEVFTDEYCDDFYMSGYGDIPYAEAEVIDGDGSLLGTGTLDGGYDTDDSCVFSATFEVRRSPDGMYRITAGNNNRGYLTYDEDDISNDRLVIEASLG